MVHEMSTINFNYSEHTHKDTYITEVKVKRKSDTNYTSESKVQGQDKFKKTYDHTS